MSDKAAILSNPQTDPVRDIKTSQERPHLQNKDKKNSSPYFIQPKLTVGAPDDPYEKEADSVADRIMRMPQRSKIESKDEEEIQTKPNDQIMQLKCAECEREDKLQKKSISETINDNQIARKISVEDPDSMIPNPGG